MRFKTFSGSFSRYWNEILFFFSIFFCQNMLKNEISIQNLKNIQNISCLTSTWVSNSLKGHPLVCNLGLQSFKGTYLATVLQSWFIGVRFFKAEICPGSHSLRGYQWSLKDSGVRVGGRIARGIFLMGKSTISMAIFNSYVSHYQRVSPHPRVANFRLSFAMAVRISAGVLNLVDVNT